MKEPMNHDVHEWQGRGRRHILVGLFIVIIGALFLARSLGVDFPYWFFSWPMLLIGLGIISGLRHNFRGGGWLVMLLVGGVFLADNISDNFNVRPFFWPLIFIGIGVYIMTGGAGARRFRNKGRWMPAPGEEPLQAGNPMLEDPAAGVAVTSDVINITAVFAGIKKHVFTKQFRGGEITSVMGGSEVNFSKADMVATATIDTFTMFGGVKLIVPADWDVQSNVVAVFGGIDDKRPPTGPHNPGKILLLEGTCLFGGIEIRSY